MKNNKKGVKDADTMNMPIINRVKDGMNPGGSMYKDHGASKFGNMLNRKPQTEEERLQAQKNKGKAIDFASKNPDLIKKGISLLAGGGMYDKMGASSFATEGLIDKTKAIVKGAIQRGKDHSKIEAPKLKGGSMYDNMGASSVRGEMGERRRERRNERREEKNSTSKKVLAAKASNPPSLSQQATGASKYIKPKTGSSMNAYQDKEASMDDYSHEKKLKADGRYEAAKGKMSNARNDFDHAHALKKDASYDAKGRDSVMKHMKKTK